MRIISSLRVLEQFLGFGVEQALVTQTDEMGTTAVSITSTDTTMTFGLNTDAGGYQTVTVAKPVRCSQYLLFMQ